MNDDNNPFYDPSLVDKHTVITTPDGRTLTVHQPGALASSNWRFNQKMVDTYMPYFEQGVRAWPVETEFKVPDGVSPNTFVARMRDVRKAILEYNYNLPLKALLEPLADAFTISMDPSGKSVWFRAKAQRGAMRKYKVETVSVKRALHAPSQVIPMPDDRALHSMCHLLSTKIVTTPFLVRGRVLDPLRSTLESSYDIAFAYDELTDITTII